MNNLLVGFSSSVLVLAVVEATVEGTSKALAAIMRGPVALIVKSVFDL